MLPHCRANVLYVLWQEGGAPSALSQLLSQFQSPWMEQGWRWEMLRGLSVQLSVLSVALLPFRIGMPENPNACSISLL